MPVRQFAPDEVDLVPTQVGDGRPGALMRVQIGDTEYVDIKLTMPVLGRMMADADSIRRGHVTPA